jgi:hypothetical protein
MTSPVPTIDFRDYYDLEQYLFETVSKRFAQERSLGALDFFCIVIWKANRAKSKIAKRLLSHASYPDLDTAARALTVEVACSATPKDRLRILLDGWGFRLPMASAILTVLYPDEFTVYDVNVCDALGDFHRLNHVSRFNEIWSAFALYTAAVQANGPVGFSLRDKDRWLWGKTFAQQLKSDIANKFTRAESDSAAEQ